MFEIINYYKFLVYQLVRRRKKNQKKEEERAKKKNVSVMVSIMVDLASSFGMRNEILEFNKNKK